jgi:hypothetical protein
VDINANLSIAKKLGNIENYKAAIAFFKKKNLRRHTYVLIRKDAPTDTSPECYTNCFGEFKDKLGPNPILLAPAL